VASLTRGNWKKIQERALRFVLNEPNVSYRELLLISKKDVLYKCRLRILLCEVYKCIHNIEPCFLSEYFCIKSCNYDFRNSCLLTLPKFNTVTYGKKSLQFHGAKLWNMLPNHYKMAENISKFKKC
jgi:hypothetical protein